LSTSEIYDAVIRLASMWHADMSGQPLKHLDIGAGEGGLIRLASTKLPLESHACDFHVERFSQATVPMKQVNLNHASLPYADAEFDLVTCSEVIEHLENYRALLREAGRVLKPGGLFVVTTPNVLNVFSRVRYLATGFANLFGPLPVKNDKLYSTGGHITPIPYFYLAHALLDADFEHISLDIDKTQRTSVLWLVALFPFIALGWLRFGALERKKYKTLTTENEPHVGQHRSWMLFVGRTIVVSARKPPSR